MYTVANTIEVKVWSVCTFLATTFFVLPFIIKIHNYLPIMKQKYQFAALSLLSVN